MPDSPMTPVDVYASLKLLESGLKAAITAASEAAERFRAATRAKQLETDYGLVYLTRREPQITVDDAALLHWAETHAPQAITRTISPAAKKAITSGWEVDGDDVIDPTTGEVVEFATVKPGGQSLTTRLTPAAKTLAATVMIERAADLTANFRQLLTAAPVEIDGGDGE